MTTKKSMLLAVALVGAFCVFATAPASAVGGGYGCTQCSLNGPALNGISLNGLKLNGITWNGMSLQGVSLQGMSLQGINLQGIRLNGLSIQGIQFNGIRLNGALLQGGQRPAGPQCTERGVDFSAVPLAKVTVRLPQPVR